MSELIIALLIFICCLMAYNIYLNKKGLSDESIENDEILSEITESLTDQKTSLKIQKEEKTTLMTVKHLI